MTHSAFGINAGILEAGRTVRRNARAAVGHVGVVYASLLVLSCGGTPTSPPPPPPVPTTRVIQQGTVELAAPTTDEYFFAAARVDDSASGRWEATVDWSLVSNTLWMWVAEGVCTVEQFALPECPGEPSCPCRFAVRSETNLPKPRVLTIAGAVGGTRTLIVANLGPREEKVEYRVTMTSASLVDGGGLGDPEARTLQVSSGHKSRLRKP